MAKVLPLTGRGQPVNTNPNTKQSDGQDRAEKCLKAIEELTVKYNCNIVPQVIIVGNQIESNIMVIAKADEPTKVTA